MCIFAFLAHVTGYFFFHTFNILLMLIICQRVVPIIWKMEENVTTDSPEYKDQYAYLHDHYKQIGEFMVSKRCHIWEKS